MRPRSRALIFRHGPFSNARRAARTALSTSDASPSATWAITSPVAGLIVSNVRPLVEFTHLPSISILVWVTLTFAADGAPVVAEVALLAEALAVAVGMPNSFRLVSRSIPVGLAVWTTRGAGDER